VDVINTDLEGGVTRMKADVTDPGLCPTVSFGIIGFEQLVLLP
jgi:hypothetical protein